MQMRPRGHVTTTRAAHLQHSRRTESMYGALRIARNTTVINFVATTRLSHAAAGSRIEKVRMIDLAQSFAPQRVAWATWAGALRVAVLHIARRRA